MITKVCGRQPRRAFNRGLTDDSKGIGYPSIGLTRHDVTAAHYEWIPATHVVTLIDGLIHDEPTWRCHQNPFIGALGTLCLAVDLSIKPLGMLEVTCVLAVNKRL
jgi:hypothetical protein